MDDIGRSPTPGRIFISYRREDTAYPAGWLYDRLVEHYGTEQVFKDVDSIQLGEDYVDVITRAVSACDVLLALIGHEWLTCTDERGRQRLADPSDFVRLEIEAALTRDVLVIPILIDAAAMPTPDDVPSSMAKLVRRQALELSPNRFDFDTSRLLRALDATLHEVWTGLSAAKVSESPPHREGDAAENGPASRQDAHQPQVHDGSGDTPVSASAVPPAPPPSGPDVPSHRAVSPVWAWAGATVVAVAVLTAAVVIASRDGSSTSPGPGGPEESTRASTGSVVFEDDFSSDAAGWGLVGPETARGDYQGGGFRITAQAVPDGSSPGMAPLNVSAVYPSAGPDIRIGVDVRRLAGRQDTGYGLGCRTGDGVGYAFMIWHDESNRPYAAIWKVLDRAPFIKPLKENPLPAFDEGGINRLAAACTGAPGKGSAHLTFSVNGTNLVAEDTDSPLRTGTVALMVGTGENAIGPLQAQFDNVVVKKL